MCFVVFGSAFAENRLPAFYQVVQNYHPSETLILDRSGKVIHEVRTDMTRRRLDWIQLAQISPTFLKTILQIEDQRFYQHRGVDYFALVGALTRLFYLERPRGASTVTMQLVSLLNRPEAGKSGRRTLFQKWNQMRTARQLEREWTKEQILEAYLNLASFRGELQGLAVAAEGLLGQEPHGLSFEDSVVLSALIQMPNAGEKRVKARACVLTKQVFRKNSCDSIVSLVKKVLAREYRITRKKNHAFHVAQQMIQKNEQGDRLLHTTLDFRIQKWVREALADQVLHLKKQNLTDAAVLVLDNSSGEVIAYVGNAGPEVSKTPYVDGVRGLRQAGSTLKPFIYGLAFDKKLITPSSWLSDTELEVPLSPGRVYRPRNYDERFRGWVRAKSALASSLNIPAVRVLDLLGGGAELLDRFEEMEFLIEYDAETYGPSLALGSLDVDLWTLTNAYRALANGGIWTPAFFKKSNRSKQREIRVLSRGATFLVADALSDRGARSMTFGLENVLSSRFWTAVKTGTSKDMRDNWCIGFSKKYTVGVWAGNMNGEPMWNVSGVDGAAPLWLSVMSKLHMKEFNHSPLPPNGDVTLSVDGFWYLTGTDSGQSEGSNHFSSIVGPSGPVTLAENVQILSPTDQAVIALDPDIPTSKQRVFFEAKLNRGSGERKRDSGMIWELNGKKLDRAGNDYAWRPHRGKYRLALKNKQTGELADEVEFEVR